MFLKWGLVLILVSGLVLLLGLSCLVVEKMFMVEYYLLLLSNFELKIYFIFDWMSLMFVGVVMFISGMVVIYSNDYMYMEKYKIYFLYGVLLFVGSMILMIMSPNLFMILLGWDGLGLVSFCLVIFYQNYKSDAAGMITILSNRIGDVMIMLCFVFLLNFGSLDFFVFTKMYWVCGYMLMIAGMTSSAQIPFSAWLPAAMAAPTPVSSLVHSSTLVTAGVYLMIRLNLLLNLEEFSKFLLFFSVMTMMMAGLGAMVETDLKKVIALSTLSQLGLMMMILSLGKFDLSFFHLMTHALFKAMLFLCAGFMIHSSMGSQDIRFMGNFYVMNPFISVAFSLANMALFGIPFLSGFYSKDLILEFIYMTNCKFLLLMMIIFSTVCTSIYSLRVMYYSLWKGGLSMVDFNYHWSFYMEVPIFVMGTMILFFGSAMSWLLLINYDEIILNFELKLINLLIISGGIYMFIMIYESVGIMNLGIVSEFLGRMWFMASFSGPIFAKSLEKGVTYYNYDSSWLEELGPQGLYSFNWMFSMMVNWFQLNSFSSMLFFWLFLFILVL
uniref:NADH dehydrogenase subunit 5 n=1 Tax=Alectorobius guaporensis TaxID=1783522 RepID=UPI002238D066|nr:NADH dehydrogenase subunit 5 [Alectorobius guaporensis]UYB78347.1 NADH dehydrogenase subunit 5 [Alectorobius guaporensis]UYB78360.1 NADH dehydrogenase subunit 5 [Alectorobius guaporensis]